MSRKYSPAFKRSALSLAVLAAVQFAPLAQAQLDADSNDMDGAIEEVVVMGKRSSLIKSLDRKRNANAVIDSISAEELGKFPDANVADSLSHIAGVTVQRTRGGEGQYVNIRGLGPDFSIVTLNNRILATDDDGRDFAFDVLPSEMIGGADVLKSPVAKNPEGSIGGSVNLRSARPFDNPGFHGSASVQGSYNDLSEENGYKFSGVVSNTFADETMGYLLGITRSSEDMRTDSVTEVSIGDWLDMEIDGVQREGVKFVEFFANAVYLEQRERTGLTGSFQYRPTDRLEMTFDAIATRLDSPAQGYTQSFYLGDIDTRGSDIVYDEEANLITSVAYDNFVPEVVTQTEERVVDTYQLGWNTEFKATDNLTLNADVYWSKSERDAGGKDNFVVAGIKGDQENGSGNFGRFTLNGNGLPDIDIILDSAADGRTFEEANNDDYGVHYIEYGGTDIVDEVLGASFDGAFVIDNGGVIESLDFGVQYTDRQKDRIKIDNETSLCLYCNYPFTFGSVGANVVRPFPIDNFFDGVSGDFPRSFAVFDIPAYIEALKAVDGTGENPLNGVPYDSSLLEVKPNAVQSYNVQEETLAAYLQANFRGDNWFGNLGLRVVTTDVSSTGAVRDIVSVAEYGDGEAAISDMSVTYSDPRPMSASSDYTKVLPSMNLGYEITDDLLLRVSAAQVMARPSLDPLSFIVDDAGPRDGYFYIGHQGSPYLDPIEADQADIGLEWYYSDESALTGVVFWKDIDGFITTKLETDVPAESIVTGEFDPELIPDGFVTETVLNGDKAKVLGLELGMQHFFSNGIGIVANYTYTDTESIVEGEDVGDLEGIARDSYSLSVIYEKDKLSAQVSADYSGEITVANETVIGGPGVAAKSEPMTWLSASIHYDLTDSLGIYIEGNNLLSENYKAYAGRKDVPMSYEVYGRSYYAGINYSF